jgi:hypothetical protein
MPTCYYCKHDRIVDEFDEDTKKHPQNVYQFLVNGILCEVQRAGLFGWQGVVCMPSNHPDFSSTLSDINRKYDVHNGIDTFSQGIMTFTGKNKACNINSRNWDILNPYRPFEYFKEQVKHLATQVYINDDSKQKKPTKIEIDIKGLVIDEDSNQNNIESTLDELLSTISKNNTSPKSSTDELLSTILKNNTSAKTSTDELLSTIFNFKPTTNDPLPENNRVGTPCVPKKGIEKRFAAKNKKTEDTNKKILKKLTAIQRSLEILVNGEESTMAMPSPTIMDEELGDAAQEPCQDNPDPKSEITDV